MTTQAATRPAALLLRRAASELERCRALVMAVEHAVEHLPPSERHADLQGIDLLDQTLGDLRAALDAIARSAEVEAVILHGADHLLSPLRLGAVRARLLDVPQDHEGGDVELF